MHQLSPSACMLQVKQLLRQCENMQNELVFILLDQKPLSNSPVLMTSGSVQSAMLKNRGGDLENKTFSAGGCDVKIPPGVVNPSLSNTPLVLKVRPYYLYY